MNRGKFQIVIGVIGVLLANVVMLEFDPPNDIAGSLVVMAISLTIALISAGVVWNGYRRMRRASGASRPPEPRPGQALELGEQGE